MDRKKGVREKGAIEKWGLRKGIGKGSWRKRRTKGAEGLEERKGYRKGSEPWERKRTMGKEGIVERKFAREKGRVSEKVSQRKRKVQGKERGP